MRHSRGFSLIEAFLALFLLMVLLSGLYAVMLSGLDSIRQARAFAAAQQQALQGMASVLTEFSNSTPASVTLAPEHVIFLSPEPPLPTGGAFVFSPAGKLMWQKWVCFYRDGAAKQLVRAEIPLSAAIDEAVPSPPVPSLADFQAAAQRQTVARNISAASFANEAFPDCFLVRIEAAEQVTSEQITEVHLESTVRMVN
ncbi:MAG: prepilin-type N-terminal cleavage/methylation domain-containing protein [Vulcanimicrobiota bacterium]